MKRQLGRGVMLALALGTLAVVARPGRGSDGTVPPPRAGHVPPTLPAGEEPERAAKVIGADDRILVEAPGRYPFSAVGKLYSTFVDGSTIEGTAVMVGPRHALTAAHVVHDPDRGGDATDLELVLALDAGDAPLGSAFGKRIQTFPRFVKRGDPRYDVALITLDVRAGDESGWFGLGVADDSALLSWPVNTAGYPTGLLPAASMWYAGDFPEAVTDSALLLGDSFDTSYGQAGSGVWRRDEKDDRFVVAVLTGETDQRNVAVRITHELFGHLAAWLDGFDGPADLAPQTIATDLPFEVRSSAEGTVTCEVVNRGLRRATVSVEAVLDRDGLTRDAIGSVTTDVRARDTVRVAVPVVVPVDAEVGPYDIVVVVNGDFGAPESDRDDNEGRGPAVYVAPAPPDSVDWLLAPLPAKLRQKLEPGGEARHVVEVSEPGRGLRVRFRGRRFQGEALLVGPDGSQYRLRTRGSRNVTVDDASPGSWRILVRNPSTAPKARAFRLKAKLR